jgi:oligoendopeptidase F
VVQSIVCVLIDEFEREVYALESVEGYTSEDFDAIMDGVCSKYVSLDYLNQNIVDINQYWRLTATNSPVYYISYAVSMTEALCIFSAAEEDREAGRELYRMLIEEVDENDGFLEAIDKIGLASPFDEKTLQDILAALLK